MCGIYNQNFVWDLKISWEPGSQVPRDSPTLTQTDTDTNTNKTKVDNDIWEPNSFPARNFEGQIHIW